MFYISDEVNNIIAGKDYAIPIAEKQMDGSRLREKVVPHKN